MSGLDPLRIANAKLTAAADGGTVGHVELALSLGADINHTDNYGANMLLRAAIKNPNPEVCHYLADRGLSFSGYTNIGQTTEVTAVHAFTIRGWMDLLARALDAGVPVDAKDSDRQTAIQLAVKTNAEATRMLASRGADLSQQRRGFGGLMHLATAENCETLVSLGLGIDVVDPSGQTPLHHAAYGGDEEKCRTLISLGADLEQRCEAGYTAVLYAAMSGAAKALAVLLDAGANANAERSGFTLGSACLKKPALIPVVQAYEARAAMRRHVNTKAGRAPS